MFQQSYPTALASCGHFDFSAFRTAVDVGGGTGGFVVALFERLPNIRATIFDLPPVEGVATETIARHGLQKRINFAHGDFFSDPLPALPAGVLYVMGDILLD